MEAMEPEAQPPRSTEASAAETSAADQTADQAADGVWVCRTEAISEDGRAAGPLEKPLTVGEKFLLTCEGATVPLDAGKVTLRLPREEKYSLRLLRVQSLDENRGVFTATSYRVGEGPIKGVALTDGTRSIELQGVALRLESSIDAQENPEGKPYSPPDPVKILWPLWLWLAVVAVCLALGAVAFFLVRRRSQRRTLLAELQRHGTALSPYHQFNKDLRLLAREFPMNKPADWTSEVAARYVEELNRHFRWYLAREFTVPAFQWGDKLILNEVKKRDGRLHRSVHKDLRLALEELNRGIKARERLSALDGQQLVELCRKVADDVDLWRRGARAARGAEPVGGRGEDRGEGRNPGGGGRSP